MVGPEVFLHAEGLNRPEHLRKNRIMQRVPDLAQDDCVCIGVLHDPQNNFNRCEGALCTSAPALEDVMCVSLGPDILMETIEGGCNHPVKLNLSHRGHLCYR